MIDKEGSNTIGQGPYSVWSPPLPLHPLDVHLVVVSHSKLLVTSHPNMPGVSGGQNPPLACLLGPA